MQLEIEVEGGVFDLWLVEGVLDPGRLIKLKCSSLPNPSG